MSSVHSEWTQHENKLFEMALAEVDPNSPDRFEKIASKVPGKTVEQVQIHYQMLVDDIDMIEADEFPIPNYIEIVEDDDSDIIPVSKKRAKKEPTHPMSTKGIPWTDEEHRMFLIGLKNCGKGDWRNISRNYVRSRTPTQVASHAQKHYLRISSTSNTNSSAGGTGTATRTTTTRHPRSSIHDIRNKEADDDHHQAPVPQPQLIKNNTVLSAKNNFIPIVPAPYPSTEAFSSSSFSSISSTARTTSPLPTLRRTTTSNLITNSNFNNGPSRLGRSPQILNNMGNYGSSSYSPSTFMMSSAPQAVPQQQYLPLHHQYQMTAAAIGGAFYGSSTAGYPYSTNYNNNNNSSGTNRTHMLMNYQQAPQIQSSSPYGYNTGLWGNERSTGSGSGGVVFELGPTAAEPPATAYRSSGSSGGVVFELGPTVAEPPAATTYRSSTGTGSGGGFFQLGPTVAEPPAAAAYRSSTGSGSGSGGGGVVFHLGPTVAEPPAAAAAAAAPAPNDISMDVDDNNTNIINHPYNYDQPIYSPAYDDLYPYICD